MVDFTDVGSKPKRTFRNMMYLVLGVIVLICSPFIVMGSFEDLDAKEIMVIQSVFGELRVYTEQGPKWQGWGKVTKYPRRDQYSFSSAKDQGSTGDQSIRTGFNDGGEGKVSGVMSWEMPLKEDQVIRLHKEYNSFIAIEQQLIRPMLEKVIFGTGATMSSFESNSERKSEIPQTIDDQLQNGPFLTKVVVTNVKDTITKEEKTVRAVQVATDEKGKIIRASASTIREYGITLSPVTVNAIDYEDKVKKQIAERQSSTQAVQLSMAAAVRATQDAVTTEQQGRADAAKAKWAQETINAKDIAEAEKGKKVAELAAQTAEQVKRKLILEGEGEAAKKRLVMEADGALEKKLEALVKINGYWADATAKAQPGAWSPVVSMGKSGAGGDSNSAQSLVELLTASKAQQLGLDMKIPVNAGKR